MFAITPFMKKRLPQTLATVLCFASLAIHAGAAQAGAFNCRAFATEPDGCFELIRDLVTDEFTKKYPVSKYEIVVIASSTLYDDGSGSGIAIVGVAPAKRGAVPLQRFNSFFILGNASLVQVHEREKRAVRYAVANMVRTLTGKSDSQQQLPQVSRTGASAIRQSPNCRIVHDSVPQTQSTNVCDYNNLGPTNCRDVFNTTYVSVSKTVCD